MPVVRSRILDASSAAQPARRVTAHLEASAAWLDDRTGQILTHLETTTDLAGWWELDLTPTGDLEAADAHYVIREYATPGGVPTETMIVVPDDNDTHLMRTLVAVAPDPVGWTPLTGTLTYRYDQTTAAAVTTIVHNLGRYPAGVSLHSLDLTVNYDEYMVQHLDTNTLRISMDTPTEFTALLI